VFPPGVAADRDAVPARRFASPATRLIDVAMITVPSGRQSQAWPQCRAADPLGLDVGVRDLERRADGQGQVGEVGVLRGSASLKSIPPPRPQ